MARGSAPFTEADVKRILKGAKAAGVPVRLEYADGKLIVTELASNAITVGKPDDLDSELEEWGKRHAG
jgi:hypothetical protein